MILAVVYVRASAVACYPVESAMDFTLSMIPKDLCMQYALHSFQSWIKAKKWQYKLGIVGYNA